MQTSQSSLSRMLPLLIVLSMIAVGLRSQSSYIYQSYTMPSDKSVKGLLSDQFGKEVRVQKDSQSIADYAQIQVRFLQSEGYFGAAIQKMELSADTAKVWLAQGERLLWKKLDPGNVESSMMRSAWPGSVNWEGKPLRMAEVEQLQQALLTYAENNGFPFATIQLDSFSTDSSGAYGRLYYESNRLIFIDSIRIIGKGGVSQSYLQSYLGIKPGDVYDESAIDAVSLRIRELPFLRERKASKVVFSGDGATLGVYLDAVNASAFDLLIGLLPNSEITGRFTLTGEGKLHLVNALKAGEEFRFDFSMLQQGTKDFDFLFRYPYLPWLPLGVSAGLQLYIRDSSYLDQNYNAGLTYNLRGSDNVRAFVEGDNTNSLVTDTQFVKQTMTLPAVLDMKSTLYGGGFQIERLDFRLNPRKGWSVSVDASLGSRKIIRDDQILNLTDDSGEGFDFATLYDSVEEKSTSAKAVADVKFFVGLGRRSTLHFGDRLGWVYNDNLFENELFRLGGSKLLRGFDEQSILSSFYNILTMEYRYLISSKGYVALFTDFAYTENRSGEHLITDWPFGFGLGLNLETKAGIFGLSYALGRQQQNPLQLRSAKIHFGYVNYF